jgi:predicted transcriptional regulator
VKIHDDYWKIIKDDDFFADYNNYFNRFSGDFEFSREAFEFATGDFREELQKELRKRWEIEDGRPWIRKTCHENFAQKAW